MGATIRSFYLAQSSLLG